MLVQSIALALLSVGQLNSAGVEYEHYPTSADAVVMTLADIGSVPEEERIYQRYVWVADGDSGMGRQVGYASNASLSRAGFVILPAVVADRHLIRLDLRKLYPQRKDLIEGFKLWDEMADVEPYLHVPSYVQVSVPKYKASDGKTYDWKVQKISAFGSHVDLRQAVMLQGLTKCNSPVVRADYFIQKTLTTLNGGMYYKFRGIDKIKAVKGKTQLDVYLESRGIDLKEVVKQRSDMKIAVFKSKVTGKPRAILMVHGEGGRDGTGAVFITFDIADEDVKAGQHPIRNLLNFKFKAQEVILELNNGMHEFSLWNDKGELQDSVPDAVTKDHRIPDSNGTARLEPGMACIRCHGPDQGLKTANNDVRLIKSRRLDIFGDLSEIEKGIPLEDTLDRLVGLYDGDFGKRIRRGRDDYSDAVYKATGGYSVETISAGLAATMQKRVYDDVSTEQALLEWGFKLTARSKEKREKDAITLINHLLPPLPKNEFGISPEDPILGLGLKLGVNVIRSDFDQVYPDGAFRSVQTLLLEKQHAEKPRR